MWGFTWHIAKGKEPALGAMQHSPGPSPGPAHPAMPIQRTQGVPQGQPALLQLRPALGASAPAYYY